MTQEEKATAYKMVEEVEAQILGLINSLGKSREWSLAVTKMEESVMWMRRAIERA